MPDYRLATRRAARQFGVDPNILLRLIQQESGFNPNARSPAGAQGIAQFMPATARAYGVNLSDNRVTDDLQGAARYLAANLRRTGGNYAQALSIYNSGSPTGYQRIPETRNYVRSILGGAAPEAPRRSGGVGPGVQGSLTVSPGVAPGFDAGNGAGDPGVLAGLLQQPQAPPPLQVQAPNSALKYLTGSGNVPVAQAPAPRVDVGALAGLLQPSEGLPEAQGQAPRVSVNVSGSPTAHAASTRAAGVVKFEGTPVAAWIKPELEYARQHGWKGTVQSGVRSFAEQSRIYASGVRPAAKPGTSNHEGTQFPRGAIDVTDAQTLARILRRKGSPLVWAGGKDPVHFSHPHGGSY
jgi:hypothetical protein